MKKIIHGLEIARWVGVILGFQCAFYFGSGPLERLHILVPFVVISLAGLTGIESVFFGQAASKETGYARSAYQRQSGFNNLASAIVAIVVLLMEWGPYAELTVLSVVLVFLVFSAVNHGYSAWREGNRGWKNLARPFMTLILIVATLPVMLAALQALQ